MLTYHKHLEDMLPAGEKLMTIFTPVFITSFYVSYCMVAGLNILSKMKCLLEETQPCESETTTAFKIWCRPNLN